MNQETQKPSEQPVSEAASGIASGKPVEEAQSYPETPPPRTGLSRGVTLAQTLVISLLASTMSGYVAYMAASNAAKTESQVAIVDANYLMMAKVGDMASQPNSTAVQMANQFIGELSQVMKYYADHGILVINSANALNKPAGIDITAQVAQAMNIKPAPPVVPPTQAPATPPVAPASQ